MAFDTKADEGEHDGCILLYNARAASWKKAREKYKHWFSGSIHVPVQHVSEDWLKEHLPQRLVVMGGDGTVHSVANAILHCGLDIPLGIIPGGGGNDFFKRLIHHSDLIGTDGFMHQDIFKVEHTDTTTQKYAINILEWGIGAKRMMKENCCPER